MILFQILNRTFLTRIKFYLLDVFTSKNENVLMTTNSNGLYLFQIDAKLALTAIAMLPTNYSLFLYHKKLVLILK